MRLPGDRFLFLAGVVFWSTLGCAAPEERSTVPIVRDADRIFEQPVRSWKTIRQDNVVMQQRDYSCGAAALATVVRYYWEDPMTELDFLEAILATLTPEQLEDRIENGLSMTDLRKAAVEKGYLSVIGRRDLDELFEARVPLIVRIVKDDFEHFVVLRGFVEDRVFLADPLRGNIRISIEDFVDQWNEGKTEDGVVLVVAKPGEGPRDITPLSIVRPPCTPVRHELWTAHRALVLGNQQSR